MLLGRSGGATDCVVAWSPPRPQRAPASPSSHTVELMWMTVYLEFGFLHSNVRAHKSHTRTRSLSVSALWHHHGHQDTRSTHAQYRYSLPYIVLIILSLRRDGVASSPLEYGTLGYPTCVSSPERGQRGESARFEMLRARCIFVPQLPDVVGCNAFFSATVGDRLACCSIDWIEQVEGQRLPLAPAAATRPLAGLNQT